MKQVLLLTAAAILLILNHAFPQSVSFSGEKVIQGIMAEKVTSVFTCDIDGDNDADVLSSSETDSKIAWYENDGTGDFGTQQHLISGNATLARVVIAADLDNDNDMDVIAGYDNSVVWFENDGSGNFGQENVITRDAEYIASVCAADLDNDNDTDVLSASSWDDKVAWYRNDGNGNFGPQTIINTQADRPRSVTAADLNADGMLDVISASYSDDKIAWYKNNGNGNFGSQNVITYSADGAECVKAADMNADGLADVVALCRESEELLWFENIGNGFLQHTADEYAWAGNSIELYDITGDGLTDIIYGGAYIIAMENEGDGSFSDLFTRGYGVRFSVAVADIDGDSHHDLVAACQNHHEICWFDYNQSGVFTERNVVYSIENPKDIFVTDVNNDQLPDVFAASMDDGKVTFYRNMGDGTFDHQVVLCASAPEARSVYAADLDGDGDPDALSASSENNSVYWYKNFGNGIFSGPMQVYTPVSLEPWSVYADDLDGDGDNDVLTAYRGEYEIYWYENNGQGTFTNLHVVDDFAPGAWLAVSGDIDGDTDHDVLAAVNYDKEVDWYENGGFGIYNAPQVIFDDAMWTTEIALADLDNDGDNDVLLATEYDDRISWFRNDGFGNFSPQIVVTSTALGVQCVFPCDIDLDGKIDLVSASKDDNKITWFKNNGGGQFSNEIIVSDSAITAMSVYAADMDNDGDNDIISANAGDNKIAWYENLLIVKAENISPVGAILQQNYPNPFNISTTIPFHISEKGSVKLSICDIYGRTVAVLTDKELVPGSYEVKFEGNSITPGIYLCRLDTKGSCSIKKMVISD